MTPVYIPIVKAKDGELDALAQLRPQSAPKILPLFELAKVTDKVRSAARFRDSTAVVEDYLNELADGIAAVRRGMDAMVDFSSWKPDACIESGEHVLSYVHSQLESSGVAVHPVIGYGRWDNPEYQQALAGLELLENRYFCLRLDSDAFEDMDDPDFFEEQIDDILTTLGIDAANCAVLIDLGDVTNRAVPDLQTEIGRAAAILRPRRFRYMAIAGCSLPTNIAEAVKDRDSIGTVLRREMVAWRAIRLGDPVTPLVFGDYGVRNPRAVDDVFSPDANGKIRYTIDKGYFVARGHSKRVGNKGAQHYDLAQAVVSSSHYAGAAFSWGDRRILACSNGEFKGNATTWIAIDTNHHVEAVLSEIFEFEHSLIVASKSVTPKVS